MNTNIEVDGTTKTTITDSDRKALARVLSMALHVQSNVPALKEIGINTANGIRAIVKHFDGEPDKPAA